MAFAHLGNFGHGNSKAAASGFVATMTCTPSGTISAGQLAVLWYGSDAYFPAGANTGDNINFASKITDDAGNIWSTLAGVTSGQSNIFPQCYIFVCQADFDITPATTITIQSLVQTSGQVFARGWSMHGFSHGGQLVIAVADRNPQKVTNTATDPGAITISGGVSGTTYLYLHALAAEGPNTDTYTWDVDYTQITSDGTSGGADDTNIQILGGFRIAAITGDTVDVTSNTADRDYAQTFQSVCEIPPISFPNGIPLLDDFNRANEDPLAGTWFTGACSPSSNGATTRHLQLVSNQVIHNSIDTVLGGSWNNTALAALGVGDVIAGYITLTTSDAGALIIQGINCSETANVDGLAMGRVAVSGQRIDTSLEYGSAGLTGLIDQTRLRSWVPFTNGEKYGIVITRISIGPVLQYVYYFRDIGAGWKLACAIEGNGIFAGFFAANPKYGLDVRSTNTAYDDAYYGRMTTPAPKQLPYMGVGR